MVETITDDDKRAIIYCWISPGEKDDVEIQAELQAYANACAREAGQYGLEVLRVELEVADDNDNRREALERVIRDIEAHNARVVICYSPETLSNSKKQLPSIIERVEGAGGGFLFVDNTALQEATRKLFEATSFFGNPDDDNRNKGCDEQ